jgi:HEAT repeat protein
MDQGDLRRLIAQTEGLKLDFKRRYEFNHHNPKVRRGQWDEFIKDVLALTNGNVGVANQTAYLVIGVGDEPSPDGIRALFDMRGLGLTNTQMLDRVNSACRPPLPDIHCEIVDLEGKAIVVVTIPPSPHLHETTRRLETISEDGQRSVYSENTVFIRRNEEIHPASESERRALAAEKERLLTSFYQGETDSAQWLVPERGLVEAHRAALARISRYARWGDASHTESYIRETGMRLPLFASPYDSRGDERSELLEAIRAHDRLLILGEPGMGKTVALERAVWEIAVAAEPVVPVYVPLIHYDGDLLESIRTALAETGHLRIRKADELETFIEQNQCVFLFDGLNEIAGSHRKEIHTKLGGFLRAWSTHPCIVTSRSQDSLWRRFHSREAIEDALVIQRIADYQARDYLIAHLGEQKGQELHDRLNEALRGLSRIPLMLWLIKEAGLAGEELPGNRGQLFDRFVEQVLSREQKQPRLVMVEGQTKKQALSKLAFYLQQENRLTCEPERAAEIINQMEGISYGRAILRESLLNGLLTGERQVHFLHQSVQEYFAALALRKLVSESARWRPQKEIIANLKQALGLKQDIPDLAREDWWAETLVQLAGLTHSPDWLVQQVLIANPWLAYWCIIEGQDIDEDTQRKVEAKTIWLLKCARAEKQLRTVRELARMENPRTAKHLSSALGAGDDRVVEAAREALEKLGEPAVESLLAFLGRSNELLYLPAVRALGAIWQFPQLVKLGDVDGNVRRNVAKTLGMLGDARTVEPLIAALRDSEPSVRQCAAEALGKLRDARAIQPLIAALKDDYTDRFGRRPVRQSAAWALRNIGDVRAAKSLVDGLQDASGDVRRAITQALGEIWQLSELVGLGDDDAFTREAAAMALGETGDKRAIKPLIAALRDDVEEVRWAATKALGVIWQLPGLAELGDRDEGMRRTAAIALKGLGDARAMEPLIAALRDNDRYVRRNAAKALRTIGESAAARLTVMLQDSDRRVWRGAIQALGGIWEIPELVKLADPAWVERRRAAVALRHLEDDRILEPLIAALQDSNSAVRAEVARALGELENPEAKEALTARLQDSDRQVRRQARQALQRLSTTAPRVE